MSRALPYNVHAAVEIVGGAAVMAAAVLLDLGLAATIVAMVFGAVAIAAAIEIGGPQRRVPLSAHASFDYLLAATTVVAGVAIGVTAGEPRAMVFLVGVGAAQVALTASTRWSVPAGV
jgi:hypothetical protein